VGNVRLWQLIKSTVLLLLELDRVVYGLIVKKKDGGFEQFRQSWKCGRQRGRG
jgi:hypothetical protein